MKIAENDAEFYERLWRRFVGGKFSVAQLAHIIRADGGHDSAGISDQDVMRLIEGSFNGDWHEVVFSMSELLSYYAALADGLENAHVVGWVFASFAMSDAIHIGAADWEMQINSFLSSLCFAKAHLEPEETVFVLRRVFAIR